IKILPDVVRITAASVFVNVAQLELVLLRDFKENMLYLLLLVHTKVNASSGNMLEVTTASEYQVNAARIRSIEVGSTRYYLGKANVVADAFSRKERVKPRRVRAMSMTIRSSVTNKILTAQGEASKVGNATAEMLRGLDQQMEKKEDGGLYFIDRGWDSIDR
ncbi:hypothetical protein Tco_1539967, partial [Tanacetum coccineum]